MTIISVEYGLRLANNPETLCLANFSRGLRNSATKIFLFDTHEQFLDTNSVIFSLASSSEKTCCGILVTTIRVFKNFEILSVNFKRNDCFSDLSYYTKSFKAYA